MITGYCNLTHRLSMATEVIEAINEQGGFCIINPRDLKLPEIIRREEEYK
jgi:hypothetical protein